MASSTFYCLLPSIVWHALGLALFVNWNDVFHNPPIHFTDYATHYAGVVAANHFLSNGQLWGYDPFFHAGFPGGTLFDVDNKAVEVASWTLYRLGIPLPHAFNTVVLSIMALAPFSVYLAARTMGLAPRVAGLAQLTALAVWYGDPTVRWMWQGGVISFAAAALGSLAVAAAFGRWAEQRGKTTESQLLWFGLGPLLFWLHPWAFFMLAVPIGGYLLTSWPRWTWRARLTVLVWVGWVLLLNWPWLSVLLRFLNTKTPSNHYLQGGLPQLLNDVRTPHVAFFRLAVLGLAAGGLWIGWRDRQPRWLPVSISVVAWLALAYAGVYVGGGDLQPYRFVLPALALAALPAAELIARVGGQSPRRVLVLLAVLGLAAGLALYRGRPQHRLLSDGTPGDYLSGPQPAEKMVCKTLSQLDLQSGRVLTNDTRLGALLPACSGAQVIGGPFFQVWTIYGYVNATLGDDHVDRVLDRPINQLSPAELAAIFEQYNVRWVVANALIAPEGYTLANWGRDHPGLLEPLAVYGPFVVYAVQQPASWFFQGTGQVMAKYNRIEVRDASPGGILLKYHWIESLRSEPRLPLRPVYVGHDPVPFIAVDNGDLTDFAIVQHYE